MFKLFKKKQCLPEARDLLFGDLPMSHWPSETVGSEKEPWLSFVKARDCASVGRQLDAIALLQHILAMPGLESRHYAQVWHFLRQSGIAPEPAEAKALLGVVVEVTQSAGADSVAAYPDGTARYFNHSGAGVVWEAPDTSLQGEIALLLAAGLRVLDVIGPWTDARPSAPPVGQVRIYMLAPSGLHFGQGPFETMAEDSMGGPVITAATRLMQQLIAKAI